MHIPQSNGKLPLQSPIVMFLAKAFQTDPRPRQEAKSLVEADCHVIVLAWDRECEFRRVESVDGTIVVSLHHAKLKESRFALAGGALIFQALLVLESLRLVRKLHTRPIVHAHDFNTLVPACLLRMLGLASGLLYDVHELSFAAYDELFGPIMCATVRAIENWCLKYPDAIITVSDRLASYLRRENEITEVVANCPRLQDIPKISKEAARARLALPKDSFIVSSVGSIRYDSALDLILSVASMTSNEKISYVVVGGGPSASEFKQKAMAAAGTQLTISTAVPREVALTYVLASDLTWAIYRNVGVNPRVTVPWKFYESLACGVPVIVEGGTVRAELVKELECGIVAESQEPSHITSLIRSIAENPDLHRAMCERARNASMLKYNWEAMSRKLIEVYEGLAQLSNR